MIGAINAPDADFTISGSGEISGSLIGKTLKNTGGANIHYDEALSRADVGAPGAFRVGSWVEAVR